MTSPFDYDMPLYRPPSEGKNLILQATLGCSYNRCSFCMMYKTKRFRARSWAELEAEIQRGALLLPETRRVFLADGDALVLSAKRLERILDSLTRHFPKLERVSCYATPQNILSKPGAELARLQDKGLTLLYVGVESGDGPTLALIDKGVGTREIIEAGRKANAAGMSVSATVLLGAAGAERSSEHAAATAEVLNQMRPAFGSALVLLLGPLAGPYEQLMKRRTGGRWRWLSRPETLIELRDLIAHLEAPGMEFRSNHASNHLPLRGRFPDDREALLAVIDNALADPHHPALRPDYLRAL